MHKYLLSLLTILLIGGWTVVAPAGPAPAATDKAVFYVA